ncbi:stage VI sporulation protein D [Niallia sp.]|uniref:stage VI sporulation protein D n=1 Tax=Niallia sp. TaxID=2837523 RepID=UPI002899B7CC|nr:stage VI sporulation protein D [Niallia sp.]
MSQENSSILRFSLEESVWFQKGQEVADLLSISLDPNITIQENDQHIIIQGSLELSGEYKRYNEGDPEEEEAFKAPKLIHSVMEREEGVCEFLHHFPVDITIPLARVTSMEDVEIEIDTFDYVFPERSCLNLTADLTISGLASEEEENEAEEEAEEELEIAWRSSLEADDGVNDPIEEPIEIAVNPFQNISPLLEEQRAEKGAEDDLFSPFELEVRKSKEEEDDWGTNENANVPYFSEVSQEEEVLSAEPEIKVSLFRSEESVYSAEEVFKKPQQESSSEVKQEEVVLEEEELEESSSSPNEEPKKKKGLFSKTKSLTFTEFFARKEEEKHTKVKVCIVQQGDTLEKLSNRYNVNIHTLLKENRMEANQDVYEGQVLYIPGDFIEK